MRDQVPPEVFTTAYTNPRNANQNDLRGNLKTALELLQSAGYTLKGRQLVGADGKPLSVEFLLVSPTFERIVLPYIENLKRIGVDARARVVDSAQYQNRVTKFDFDIIVASFAQSLSPGNEQRDFWGSEAAGRDGSRNVIGIADPAIDKLIDAIIFAKDRADLVAATRALDRVLLWSHFVVPQWHLPAQRIAWWDHLGFPDNLPKLTPAPVQVWWHTGGDATRGAQAESK